jgi:ubiquinone/menaquinone biosynthesis C-methylase UbiE
MTGRRPGVSFLRDYSRQAQTYDRTRAASPSVLGPLRAALEGEKTQPPGRLADVGGGTGNYAAALRDEGLFDPVVADRSPEMLARAAEKGLECVQADAQALPFADASFDTAMLVSMLHHVEEPAAALAEARRILRPGGRLAVVAFTREDLASLWFADYFPSTNAWMAVSHQSLDELVAHLPGARRLPVVFADLQDASLAALAGWPELVLEDGWRRQTSFFERLERDEPEEMAEGLRRLAADLEAGRGPRGQGVASVLAWVKPR